MRAVNMRVPNMLSLLAIVLVFGALPPTGLAQDLASPWPTLNGYKRGIAKYQSTVESLREQVLLESNLPDANADKVRDAADYLRFCARFGDSLLEWAELRHADPDHLAPPPVDEYLVLKNQDRFKVATFSGRLRELIRDERNAYREDVQPLLVTPWLASLSVRRAALEVKYFDPDIDDSANFVEGWLNGYVPFLRVSDKQRWYRRHGVSAFEMTVRTEPLILLNADHENAAILGMGLLYNFLPGIEAATETIDGVDVLTGVSIKEGFFSKSVRRMGLRLAGGAFFPDDRDAEFLYGGGFQIRSVTLWGLYAPKSDEFYWSGALSDFGWLLGGAKGFLPAF